MKFFKTSQQDITAVTENTNYVWNNIIVINIFNNLTFNKLNINQ